MTESTRRRGRLYVFAAPSGAGKTSLVRALTQRDMYLSGSILLIYCFLTILGTLISDVLLALVDPRIRMEGV